MNPREHPADVPLRARASGPASETPPVHPPARRSPPVAGRDLSWNRRWARLGPVTRLRLQVRRDELLASTGGLERQIDALTRERLGILSEADQVRDDLWPVVVNHKGRRPPAVGCPPLPPVQPDARPIAGRALRSLCGELLERHGELALPDLHAWLHHYGYVIASWSGPKVLADALGYEVEMGRAIRVRWGVYAPSLDGRARPRRDGQLVDPWLDGDPPGWIGHPGFVPPPGDGR